MAELGEASRPVAAAGRLPGRARKRSVVLREYEESIAELRKRVPSVLWPFFAPDPAVVYRWRVQLDCLCVRELYTRGDQKPPSERTYRDPYGNDLPQGQMYCSHDEAEEVPYRRVCEWLDRKEINFPADPVEPPDYLDADVWSVIRHDEPHTSAFWTVALECGHIDEVIAPGLSWEPDDGALLADPARVQQMSTEFEELWVSEPDGTSERKREHTRRMLAAGWPRPSPESLCYICPHANWVVAYQRTGWLVPRVATPNGPRPTTGPVRAVLERRLRETEAQAEQLRTQLAQHAEHLSN
ncbi:hypothetical protein [Streptomyces xanthophaeus]